MHSTLRFAFVPLVLGLWLAVGPSARADGMNIALSRLKVPAGTPGCSATTGDGARRWCGADDDWRRIMSQLGASMAPPVATDARTVGPGGFFVGIETWITDIDQGQVYWRQGTEGGAQDREESCPGTSVQGCNRFPSSVLTWSRIVARKGFPFGFQLGLSVGHGWETGYTTWGAEVQWSLFEGFRQGVGVLPDLAVRGMVQTLTGDGEFNLTVPSFDVVLSKPIVAGGSMVFTPYVSAQAAWIMADSELVDLTPDVDAFEACQPQTGPPSMGDTGTIRCARDPSDFNNNYVFPQLRALRWRLAIGLRYRYEHLVLSGAFQYDLQKPADADGDVRFVDDAGNPVNELPRQWTAFFGLGFQM